METFKFSCKHCGQEYDVTPEHVGQEYECQVCAQPIVVEKKITDITAPDVISLGHKKLGEFCKSIDVSDRRYEFEEGVCDWLSSIPLSPIKRWSEDVAFISLYKHYIYLIDIKTQIRYRSLEDAAKVYRHEELPTTPEEPYDIYIWEIVPPEKSGNWEQDIPSTRYVDDCPNCAGKGQVRCGMCYGDGIKRCWRCNGTGYIKRDEERSERCCDCGGQGKNVCTECHGSGEISCDICKGTGELLFWKKLVQFEDINHVVSHYSNSDIAPEFLRTPSF